MAKFFVGQRVRLVSAVYPENNGAEGTITHMGSWGDGDTLPNGHRVRGPGHADVFVKWSRALNYTFSIAGHGPCNSQRLEPILPEGAAPSIYSYQKLMDKLKEGERV